MPGMEARAPERTETSSGFSRSPNLRPTDCSTLPRFSATAFFSSGGYVLSCVVKVRADGGRDREAGRNGNADVGHLGEARAFAAEDVFHFGVARGVTVAEVVDVCWLLHCGAIISELPPRRCCRCAAAIVAARVSGADRRFPPRRNVMRDMSVPRRASAALSESISRCAISLLRRASGWRNSCATRRSAVRA